MKGIVIKKDKRKILMFFVILFVSIAILLFTYFIYIIKSQQVSSSLNEKLLACGAIPADSIQKVKSTTRLFINLPKDVYPDKEHNLQFKTISGNASAGWISNAGLYGEAFQATPKCWSYYYGFDGEGELELRVQSVIQNMPDYIIHFVVSNI